MRLRNPACVCKTFPNFFAKLAALGAVVRSAPAGTRLSGDDAWGAYGVLNDARTSDGSTLPMIPDDLE